ncbi:polysaccharide biosynthesis/export family protein [Puniceibacterium sp. IMCC21224]|uniref:polysaccharide biosynthesis/export family protein n=1 Tax=Puniceibacterium sp. IMCC21224 TaxID=1618204 RepID=UPI00064DF5B5|nr:polysaccharide biosynthesis/export family protein [Puniceibacterium sp. IMCC21224]KMK63819.1 periplasmic protein involved in polysaccharide export [Puniceibacterium sp. IMCC21224]
MTFLKSIMAGRAIAAVVFLALALWGATGPAAAQGYGVKPGDTLRIEVLEDPSLNRTVLVAPDGRISVPQAGSLRASGRTVEAIQSDLTGRLASAFAATPNVYVSLEQLRPRDPYVARTPEEPPVIGIYILGEANKPGLIEVAPGTTVLQMFAMMGGFTKFAATKRIQLRRTDTATHTENVYSLNYPAIEAGKDRNGLTSLMDGDVIVVPQRRLFE